MPNRLKVLVTGATGNTGSLLVPRLLRADIDVRVFVRDGKKAESLNDLGAEIIIGDLDQPETIVPAVGDVDKIYLLTWNGPTQLKQAENVIKAASKAGTPHIIRHSMWGPENSRIIKQGLQVEEIIKSSGLPWTMLKPTFYMQNTMMAAQTISAQGNIYWDMKDGKLGMIDVRDIAEAAFAVITGEGHEGKSYILTGPEAISFTDIAKIFSRVLERNVNFINVPGEASFQAMVSLGVPEWIAEGYVELSKGFSEDFANSITQNIKILTGHPARSFEQFANDFAHAFISNQEVVH
ncbi:MAG TPA: SDR family oxidoreductase [Ignavibacteriaceae bacterium]|nr:SDR family oxidoreductase [Ignavibacteriaceae bacterium]